MKKERKKRKERKEKKERSDRGSRLPNLATILMVEDVLKKCKYKSVKMSELKKLLPKQVMHPTLKIVLDYLWESGKIEYTPDGIRWIFIHPDQRKKLLSGFMEVIK